MIQGDSYRPHTVEELMELVPVAVVASLDPDKRYGVSWCPLQASFRPLRLVRRRPAADLDCLGAGSRIGP
jgi:hypothetical protein